MRPWRGGARSLVTAPLRGRRRGCTDRGQATVEVAFLLPILAILAVGLLQVGLVVRSKVLTVHAAREAARAASVGEDPNAAAATSGLSPLSVQMINDGERVTAVVTYVDPTDLPIIGAVMPSVSLESRATMRVEDWPTP